MQAEDNTLKIIDTVPIFAGRSICDLPCDCLETIKSRGGRNFCRFPVKFGVGFGGGHVDSGSYQECRLSRNVGQGVELGPSAKAERGSAEEEERDVAAQAGGQFHELLYRQRFPEQQREGQEDRGRALLDPPLQSRPRGGSAFAERTQGDRYAR